jgi:hypothetical protein
MSSRRVCIQGKSRDSERYRASAQGIFKTVSVDKMSCVYAVYAVYVYAQQRP